MKTPGFVAYEAWMRARGQGSAAEGMWAEKVTAEDRMAWEAAARAVFMAYRDTIAPPKRLSSGSLRAVISDIFGDAKKKNEGKP